MNVHDWPLYHYRGVVERVTDGDTLRVLLDLGDSTYRRRNIRLIGYDAPELFRGIEREAGAAARDMLAILTPVGSVVYIATERDRTSFDRLLGRVYTRDDTGTLHDVASAMLAAGYDRDPEGE